MTYTKQGIDTDSCFSIIKVYNYCKIQPMSHKHASLILQEIKRNIQS